MIPSILSDASTLWNLIAFRDYKGDHGERLNQFYAQQGQDYDSFRERLLMGRKQLIEALPIRAGGTLLDMGGGTGRSLEWLGERLADLSSATIVDLCEPLLRVARQRIASRGWENVQAVRGDVSTYGGSPESVDSIIFSYSLTMIPNWVEAVEHAFELLRPGGSIGVADFYVSRKWPDHGMTRHSSFTRAFWPNWFSHSNVFLNPAHLDLLRKRFRTVRFEENRAIVPYLGGLSVPYYLFIGTKA
jgi:S-adenosylmethionine-diacylgycerolhomoserine-N-methlytransferase